jgi:hypothetical protein
MDRKHSHIPRKHFQTSRISNPFNIIAPLPGPSALTRKFVFPTLRDTVNRQKPARNTNMITKKQLQANRNNARLSTGPKTAEGRQRSRLNALRHGLTGQVTTMTEEDRAARDKFSEALIQNLAPVGAMENQLAQRIATDSWRLNRISAVEDNLFALGLHQSAGQLCPEQPQIDAALTTARVFTQESHQLQLLTLYEQRLNRAVEKNLALLESLQAARKVQREAEMNDAARLLQLSEMKGLEYQPAKDGFIFSTREIHSELDRQQRLRQAWSTPLSTLSARKRKTQAA